MIKRMGWQTYTSTPPRFCRRIMEEFNARMILEDYRHPAYVMVHGQEVDLIVVDINRRATVDLPGERLEPPPADIGITTRKVLEDEHDPTSNTKKTGRRKIRFEAGQSSQQGSRISLSTWTTNRNRWITTKGPQLLIHKGTRFLGRL
ncbi:hypothetical protein LWI29_004486 [Acer saccharum]|uniref:Uncharacterized protein n=1 Tax=Acer saccharum TaxID=4024 RepID=A0AA39VFI6_ACESA|nr:hypothetical protein LWI29_004486 [Acer saccharum]